MLNYDIKLFFYYVDDRKKYDFLELVVEVVRNFKNFSFWGLKNLFIVKWVVNIVDNNMKDVELGCSVILVVGIKINFGIE